MGALAPKAIFDWSILQGCITKKSPNIPEHREESVLASSPWKLEYRIDGISLCLQNFYLSSIIRLRQYQSALRRSKHFYLTFILISFFLMTVTASTASC